MPEEGLAAGQIELLDELHAKRILRGRYDSFSINEAWVNRNIVTGEKISPLFPMNATVYDKVICDQWFGVSPHEKALPKGFEKRPMVLAFVKKPYPLFYQEIFDDYARDNFLIKTMHLLAQDYKDDVYFSYVNTAIDDELIATSLGVDIIFEHTQKPVVLLIHEN